MSFDGIARGYRWMEYASFGHLLERTREVFLPELGGCRQALVLGDGDGRFLAKLLRRNPLLRAVAVDTSGRMLHLLRRRCARPGRDARLECRQGDARELPGPEGADLIVTHFFLDCLTDAEVRTLTARLGGGIEHGGLWLLSEFQVPRRGPGRPLGWLVVRGLYLAFGLLTGLRVRRLPDYQPALRSAGLTLEGRRERLGGLLVSELWRRP